MTLVWSTLLAALLLYSPVYGTLDEVDYETARRGITVTAHVYGLGPTHEITGSFLEGSRYFNSDGVFAGNGTPITCKGYRYTVTPRRGVSSITVHMPRRCIREDAGKTMTVRLLMLDPHEPGRRIYLEVAKQHVAPQPQR